MAKLSQFSGGRLAVAGLGVAIVVSAVVWLAVGTGGKTSSATPSVSASVLSPSYATSIGYPKTFQAAKSASVKGEKGCVQSIGAVYEDNAGLTALISDVLICNSHSSASSALAAARRQISVATGVSAPKGLGTSAFVTATRAPEYLVVWQAANRVAITSIDTDVKASQSTSAAKTAKPITAAQTNALFRAALAQNSLYQP
jgi:hypothetical protein